MADFNFGWPAGRTDTFEGTPVNVGAGSIVVVLTPAAGSEVWVISGTLQNRDTVARNLEALVTDAAASFVYCSLVRSQSVAATTRVSIPSMEAAVENYAPTGPVILNADTRLRLSGFAIAAAEDIRYAVMVRILGPAPTITETVS